MDDDPYEINPAYEFALFMDWCHTVAQWSNYKLTISDVGTLREFWYPSQAPADAVAKLLKDKVSA